MRKGRRGAAAGRVRMAGGARLQAELVGKRHEAAGQAERRSYHIQITIYEILY